MRELFCVLTALSMFVLLALTASVASAQDGFGLDPDDPRGTGFDRPRDERAESVVDSLWRMDANRNGLLEPEEISDEAQPYVDFYASLAELDISRPLGIEELEEAVYAHHQARGGRPTYGPDGLGAVGRDAGEPPPSFGPVDNVPPIPGFGTGEDTPDNSVKLEKADLDRAAERLRQYDTNRDGFMDRSEARSGQWSDDPFAYDRNRDGRLNQRELAERYAQRRIAEAQHQGHSSSDSRGGQASGQMSEEERRRREYEEQRRREYEQRRRQEEEERKRREVYGDQGTWRLVADLLQRYDANRDNNLDQIEWRSMGTTAPMSDANASGTVVDRAELYLWLKKRSANTSVDLPKGLPEWFGQRDLNGDGQVAMDEFVDDWTDEKAEEFVGFDLNHDGIVMPDECLLAMNQTVGKHSSRQLQVIPAGKTVYSQIVVKDDTVIADLDVQISITHSYDATLDAYLIGPGGERVELFTAVGGEDDHFSNTIFDDEATTPIRNARPPFAGRFQPEAVEKKEPSLRTFYGKRITGTWTLMIRAERSDRAGSLHGWSLIPKPLEEGATLPPVEPIEPPAEPGDEAGSPGTPPRGFGGGYRPPDDRSRPPDDRSQPPDDRRGPPFDPRDRYQPPGDRPQSPEGRPQSPGSFRGPSHSHDGRPG
ncbi:MAG TPA: proprotein convertase P-domain-containing protein [Thermoguttaceae bacterium]|nr:proprotein convertase P-domain-containing protein [Thermoguttaceae bacterium]